MNTIFVDEHGRVRSGWRSAFFAALYLTSAIMLTAFAAAFGLRPSSSDSRSILVGASIMLLPAISVGLLCTRLFEGLGPGGLGVSINRDSLKSFGLGLGVGVLTLLAALLPAIAFGNLRFTFNLFDPQSLLLAFLVMAVAAAAEEALFRGYILQTLARSGYAWLAIALTAVFFGLGHARNPGATPISIAVTVLAGVWFGVAYLRTRDLWFVWGMHLSWNWMQGSILGIEVSGLLTIAGTPLLKELDHGPDWLTGTSYGIEGSISALAAILFSTVTIHFIRHRSPPPTVTRSGF